MTNRLEEFSRNTIEAARTLATRQAEAGTHYLDVMRRFGHGDMDVAKYGTELAEVYLREGLKSAGTFVSVGSKWLQSSIIIVGGSVEDAATEAEKAVRTTARSAKAAAESKS
jgi:hypothetical protein